MRCWIDAQGYCNSAAKFIPKEVAVVTSEGHSNFVVTYTKELRSFSTFDRKLVLWATKNYHRIPYYVGDTHENILRDKILEQIAGCTNIYTKGVDKTCWLARLVKKPVVDLQVLGCPSLRKVDLAPACEHHLTRDSRCALSGALFLKNWFDGDSERDGCAASSEQQNGAETLLRSLPSGYDA